MVVKILLQFYVFAVKFIKVLDRVVLSVACQNEFYPVAVRQRKPKRRNRFSFKLDVSQKIDPVYDYDYLLLIDDLLTKLISYSKKVATASSQYPKYLRNFCSISSIF